LGLAPDFKFKQQDLTELNADGNRERGRYGEDYSKPKPPLTGSPEIATEIEEAQEEDDGQPSLYEEYQSVFGGDDWDHGQDENPSW